MLKKIAAVIPRARTMAEGLKRNIEIIRQQGFKIFSIRHWLLMQAVVRVYLNRGRYEFLNEDQIRATRKSDRVFIFGSGYSINDITPQEWEHFGEHDTLGVSGFIYQKWVRTDYHLIRGWVETGGGLRGWKTFTPDFAQTLDSNALFKDAILVMQGDYSAQFCNQLLGYGLLGKGRQVYRYRTVRLSGPPTAKLEDGLRHAVSGMCDAVNFAFCMGWKEIVLVGVDLYDNRYFWLPPDKTVGYDSQSETMVAADANMRGIRYNQTHSTAVNNFVGIMSEWDSIFKKSGTNLKVYNPKSLLKEVLPVYSRGNN